MESARTMEVALVTISGKRYGVPITAVRELLQMVEPTPVPGWPEVALGVVNLRGLRLPLVDVASALGRPPSVLDARQFLLVLETGGRWWALVVSSLEQVCEVSFQPRESLAANTALRDSVLCLGLGSLNTDTWVVLNPEGLMQTVHLPALSELAVSA